MSKFRNPEAYTASAAVFDTPCSARGLYIAEAGDLEFVPYKGADAITAPVLEGLLPWFVYQVNSAGTTATVSLRLD